MIFVFILVIVQVINSYDSQYRITLPCNKFFIINIFRASKAFFLKEENYKISSK